MASKPAPKTVALIDPNGNEHQGTNPTEINTLIFAQGYRLKDKSKTVDQAIAEMVGDTPLPPAVAEPIA